MSRDKIFVLQYKSQHEYCKNNKWNPVYVTQSGFPTIDINNAGLYEKSVEAYRNLYFGKSIKIR